MLDSPILAVCLVWLLSVQFWLLYLLVRALLRIDRRCEPWRARAGVVRHAAGDDASLFGGVTSMGLLLSHALGAVAPVGPRERAKLASALRRAGFVTSDAVAVVLCAKLVFAAALFFGVLLSLLNYGTSTFVAIAFSLAGATLGSVLPEYMVRFIAFRRTSALASSLSDVLDLMVMAVETGIAPTQALAEVVSEIRPVAPALANELSQLDAELRLGGDREQVLGAFVRRINVDGLRDFGMTLLQAGRYGTPLAESLRNLAEVERDQLATRVAARVERLPVLMTLPMIMLVVPGTGMLLVGPAVLTAFEALGGLSGGLPGQ